LAKALSTRFRLDTAQGQESATPVACPFGLQGHRRECPLFIQDHAKTAYWFRDSEVSYSQLIQETRRRAALVEVNPGDRVALFGENRPEWVSAFFATWLRRGINVPIDALCQAEDVAYILKDCRPVLLHCTPGTRAIAEAALALLAPDEAPRLVCLEDPLPEASFEATPVPDPDDTAVLIYTSGTTGGPKGVMLTFDNLQTNIEEVVEDVGIYNRDQRLLGLLPFHHIFSLQGNILAPLSCGASVALIEKPVSEEILGAMVRHKVTLLLGVPRLYALFHKGLMAKVRASLPGRLLFALSRATGGSAFGKRVFAKAQQAFGGHIRFLVSGGAKLDETVARDLRALGFDILEGYGMTEAAPMITFTRPGEILPGSPGRATRHSEIRLQDGEILVRGRHVMKGYWGRDAETAETLKDGWLHTGDLGRLDSAGRLFITGRAKELIVLPNGKNINPEEVEASIQALSPLVLEIGVFANGDALAAVVRPDAAAVRRAQVVNLRETLRLQVLDKYNLQVPPYRRVLQLSLVEEELPRTRLGKLRRFQLPALAARGEIRREAVPDPDTEAYRLLKAYLTEILERDLHPDEHLEYDLGLDSLAKIELDLFLERTFGTRFPEDAPASHGTLRELAERLSHCETRCTTEALDWSCILAEAQGTPPPDSLFMLRIMQICALPLRPFIRLKVKGLEHLPEGPCILAPNHQSMFDGLFLARALPSRVLHRTHFMATSRHFQSAFNRFYARHANVLVVDINQDLKGTLQAAATLLRSGRNLVIFPEGTRTRDGHLQPFRRTFAILARELGIPVVPVALSGAFEAFPAGRRLPHPGTIHLDFLPVIHPEGRDPGEVAQATHELIARHLH